jgi:hypothetical protein
VPPRWCVVFPASHFTQAHAISLVAHLRPLTHFTCTSRRCRAVPPVLASSYSRWLGCLSSPPSKQHNLTVPSRLPSSHFTSYSPTSESSPMKMRLESIGTPSTFFLPMLQTLVDSSPQLQFSQTRLRRESFDASFAPRDSSNG